MAERLDLIATNTCDAIETFLLYKQAQVNRRKLASLLSVTLVVPSNDTLL